MRLLRSTLVAAAAAGVLPFAACSDDAGGGDGPAATKTAAAQSVELTALKASFNASTYRGTYDLVARGGELDALDGTMILHKDGPEKLRIDLKTTQEGENITLTLISTPTDDAFCLDRAGDLAELIGTNPDEGVCFGGDAASPVDVGSFLDFFEIDETATVLERTTREVAGRNGTCYKQESGADVVTTCFSDDGAGLSAESEGADELTLRAIEISSDVSEGDFRPPYAVRVFPVGD